MGFKVDILTTSVNVKIGYERNANLYSNLLKEWMQKGLHDLNFLFYPLIKPDFFHFDLYDLKEI